MKLTGKRVLISGKAESYGNVVFDCILNSDSEGICIFSRDELKRMSSCESSRVQVI